MAINQTFVDFVTPIPADWLNNVNTVVNSVQPSVTKLNAKASVSLTDYGAKCDGVTDDTTAVQAAITALGTTQVELIVPGLTKVSDNVTFGTGTFLTIRPAAGFLGQNGTEQVYAQQQITAGAWKIFTNCVPLTAVAQFIYPEWFGAAIGGTDTVNTTAFQASSNYLQFVGGVIQAGFGTYQMSANFNIGTATGSIGQNIRFQGRGMNMTTFNLTGAAASFVQVLGASASPLQGIELQDFNVTKTPNPTGGVGIFLNYTALAKLSRIHISGMLQGVGLQRATNTIQNLILVNIVGSTNGCIGWNLDGGGIGAGGNASSVFRDCYVDATVSTGTGHIGFKAFGSYVSDLQFLACETAKCPIGYQFDMTMSLNTGNEDVQLINCRADSISTYGIFINGAGFAGSNASMISIIGGWYNSLSTGSEVDLIFCQNSRGVSITGGTQLYGAAGAANLTAIKLTGCSNITVDASTIFSEMKYGINMSNTAIAQIAGRFYSDAATPATNMIIGTGCTRIMVNGATFDGYCNGNVVNFDNTSTGCGVVTCTFNAATLTNTPRVLNSSTSPVGSSDGSTGLNSGS